jgi:hypothetical protein
VLWLFDHALIHVSRGKRPPPFLALMTHTWVDSAPTGPDKAAELEYGKGDEGLDVVKPMGDAMEQPQLGIASFHQRVA